MTKEEAISYLRQLYPNGGHCWLDEQRIEAISMAVKALKEEPVSKDFEMALAEMIAKAQKCVVEPWMVAAQWKDELIKLAKGEEPVSKDLEKISYYFACMCHPLETAYSKTSPNPDIIKAFKAGAKWKEEQDKQWLAENHKHIFAKGRESMIAKACEWLTNTEIGTFPYKLIEEFRKAMEE